MLDLENLLSQAERLYLLDSQTSFVFPVRQPAGKKDYYALLDQALQKQNFVRIHSLRMVREGLTKISRPAELSFDLNALVSKRPYLKFCKARIDKLKQVSLDIDVLKFLRQNRELLSSLELVESCVEVLLFLIQNRNSVIGLLPRQIPHGKSTKLIGRESTLLRLFSFWLNEPTTWKGFFDYFLLLDKPMEFRFYAPHCFMQKQSISGHHGVLAPEWCNDYDFSQLQATLIVENIESFYATSKFTNNSLILWGAGWRVSQIKFLLHILPKPIFYWGDIDKEGYEIFAFVQRLYPAMVSLFMDHMTIKKYQHLLQKKEKHQGPLRVIPETLQAEYEMVSRQGLQIEQEQLTERWPYNPQLA